MSTTTTALTRPEIQHVIDAEKRGFERGLADALQARTMLATALQTHEWRLVQRAYVALGGVASGPSDMTATDYLPPSLLVVPEPPPAATPPDDPQTLYQATRARVRDMTEAAYAAAAKSQGTKG